MDTQKEVMKELYDAALLTSGAVVVSYTSKKTTGKELGLPSTLSGAAKLTLSFGASALLEKFLQDKKYLPENLFKA